MPELDNLAELQKTLRQTPPEARLHCIQGYLAGIKNQSTRDSIEVAILLSQSLSSPPPKKHIVVLIHGIRTFAPWQELLSSELRRISDIDVIPLKYEFFNGFSFWCPFFTRTRPISRILNELVEIKNTYPDAHISIVAHSFGTYIISKILMNERFLAVHRVQLCGSIIPSRYQWNKVKPKISGSIINDAGTRDYWPLLAKVFSWGYGPSGLFGFGTTYVNDNFYDCGHSDYFNDFHIKNYWIPFLVDGQFVQSDWGAKRKTHGLLVSFFSWFPVKTAIAFGLAIFGSWHLLLWFISVA
jgi:hypothetical protein